MTRREPGQRSQRRQRLPVMLLCSACVSVTALTVACARADAQRAALRVCADPDNLPFSNKRLEGFENRLAVLIGQELNAPVEYTWRTQQHRYIRDTITAGTCDVWLGIPTKTDQLLVTAPYYRSSYVFVARRDRGLALRSLDDSRLSKLKIGVEIIADDGHETSPATALAVRNLARQIVPFAVYGSDAGPSPVAGMVDQVSRGDIDAAIAWGPPAAYFASRAPVALDLAPVEPQMDQRTVPLAFDISVGVSRKAPALRDAIDRALARRRAAVDRLLTAYHIPRVSDEL